MPRAVAPPAYAWSTFGSVQLDPGHRAMMVSGYVNQVEGAIELLACGPGGKVHESVFVLFAEPADIHAGLLLLGFTHGEPMAGLGEGPPRGDSLILDVEWDADGQTVRERAERFVFDFITQRPARHGAWIFNGSMVEDGYFLARAEESLIATYWDPWAIINLQSEAGADDERLGVNRSVVPPRLTPVRMIIRPDSR
ncbi:MAG TPA: YdjY domain-containing protein [Kiritimatiellia bacterium]|nr:YdjY domain-containing protein [Kiritimatiellia bacterium]HMO98397.1 YdjY domain-containing protein [Kiritimatiellia bacterium]HMP96450.1 YdjY domain-containing protein [Kiritimatiellia bacterium]